MRRFQRLSWLVLAGSLLGTATPCAARPEPTGLDQARRADGMAAVERLRSTWRGEKPETFDHRYPREFWFDRAAEIAAKTRALAERFGVRVDDGLLERELRTIAAVTEDPSRLRALFEALGNDPVAIKECLVRPAGPHRRLGGRPDDRLGRSALRPGMQRAWGRCLLRSVGRQLDRRLLHQCTLPPRASLGGMGRIQDVCLGRIRRVGPR